MPPGTPKVVSSRPSSFFNSSMLGSDDGLEHDGEVLGDAVVDELVDVVVGEGVDDVTGPHPAQHLWNIDQSPHNFVLKPSSNSSFRLDVFFFFFATPAAVDRLLP